MVSTPVACQSTFLYDRDTVADTADLTSQATKGTCSQIPIAWRIMYRARGTVFPLALTEVLEEAYTVLYLSCTVVSARVAGERSRHGQLARLVSEASSSVLPVGHPPCSTVCTEQSPSRYLLVVRHRIWGIEDRLTASLRKNDMTRHARTKSFDACMNGHVMLREVKMYRV